MSAYEHSWIVMRAEESSLVVISAKSSHHRPQGLLSMAPRCHMHSWPLYARISTLAHGFNSPHEYSWNHGNILLWVLMRAPEYCWVLSSPEHSEALLSAPECLWELLCFQVVVSTINQKMLTFHCLPCSILEISQSEYISSNNKELYIFKICTKWTL